MIQDKLNIQSIKQITMDKLIEDLQTNMSNQGLAPKTLDTYFACLSKISRTFGKDRLILLLLLNLIHTLIIFFYKDELSNATAHKYHVVFYKTFDFAIQFGYAKKNPALKVKINLKMNVLRSKIE